MVSVDGQYNDGNNKGIIYNLLLGYPTSVVEGVGDEFISVRESLNS